MRNVDVLPNQESRSCGEREAWIGCKVWTGQKWEHVWFKHYRLLSLPSINIFLFFFFFVVLGFELTDVEPLHQPFFVMSFFKIGSLRLFAQVGFKL
jgi:hypothetical protein